MRLPESVVAEVVNVPQLPAFYPAMTWQERKAVREEYVRRQNNLCHYCKASLDGKPLAKVRKLSIIKGLFPQGFFKWPVHLHHDHNTGMTIGAVHNYCNAVLWQYHGE